MAKTISDQLTSFWRGGMLNRLLFINVAVFFVTMTLTIIWRLGDIHQLSPSLTGYYFLATTADPSVLLYRPWSVITHMFVHAGIMHVAFNMIFLWFLGRWFQEYFGQRKLLATYLLGGLSGFVLMVVAYNLIPGLGMAGWAVGASAAVMAIFVGFATYFPDREIRLILIGTVKLKWVALAYVVFDYFALAGSSNVGGHIGHLGGAAYGFLLMYNMKHGRDIGLWFEKLLDKLINLGRGSTNMRVKFKRKPETTRVPKSDEEYNAEKNAMQARIDRILDKISRSGYDSLTKDEKDFLFRNSKDL